MVLVEIIPHLMVVLVVVEPVIIILVDLMDTQGQDLEEVEDQVAQSGLPHALLQRVQMV